MAIQRVAQVVITEHWHLSHGGRQQKFSLRIETGNMEIPIQYGSMDPYWTDECKVVEYAERIAEELGLEVERRR